MSSEKKYTYMLKEQKKKVREDFKNTSYGKRKNALLNRLSFEGILCLIMGIVLLVYSIVDHLKWYYYGLSIVLVLGGLLFIIGSIVVRHVEYDKFINAKKKRK